VHRARGVLACFAAARLWPAVCSPLNKLARADRDGRGEEKGDDDYGEKPGRVGYLHVAGPD